MYLELSANAQNAYAELFDSVSALDLGNAVRGLNGSFGTKEVKGNRYWYFQYRGLDGRVEQCYVGPDNERVRNLVQRHHAILPQAEAIQRLAQAAIALGCEAMLPRHFRAVRRLSEYGFFRCGGILVGTHAFIAMNNMLGIAPGEKIHTQDVDFAHSGRNISLALPSTMKIDTHEAIESLEMGLIPISTVEGKFGARYINPAAPDFRIDFLTARTSDSDAPVYVEGLKIALQPLKFMEFSMQDPVQGLALSQEGAVLVNIPRPERYAVHKLIVSAERPVTETAKVSKDVRQANSLITYYIDHRPQELKRACVEAWSNGPGWRSRLREGLENLSRINEDAAAFLQAACTSEPVPERAPSPAATKPRQQRDDYGMEP